MKMFVNYFVASANTEEKLSVLQWRRRVWLLYQNAEETSENTHIQFVDIGKCPFVITYLPALFVVVLAPGKPWEEYVGDLLSSLICHPFP